ncbi:efflux RND transporter periplasmic adaptor subunit [Brevibacillus fluminis]|uniref:efflux RND transporter periplasmic adaptor subunit n=1 Tax=Brevibacillus fluminis TaxID=511487 RepID=UPI003F8C752E
MKNKWLTVLLLSGLVVTTAACSQKDNPTAQQAPVDAKQVEAMPVKPEKVGRISELSATLQPYEEATISFEVGGRITQLAKEEGDAVKAGEVLASLDSQDYSLQLALADTTVKQSGAVLSKVNNGAREQELLQAKLLVDKATIGYQKALDDFNRVQKLFKEQAVSQNDLDNAKDALDIAQKDLESAKQSYSLTTQGARVEDKAAQRSTYDQALVAKQQAARTLSKTQLASPIQGTVLAKLNAAGQMVSPGAPVYKIGMIDTLKTVLPVPDYEIGAWKVGDSVEVALYDQKRTGKVAKIYPATNESTGTIGVEITIPNPKHDWFAGQVVKASKTIEGKTGIFVPAAAVISQGEAQPYVFVVNGGKAVKTSVTIGELIQNKLEITSGLKEGEQLVTKGADRLFDGDAIELTGGAKQ